MKRLFLQVVKIPFHTLKNVIKLVSYDSGLETFRAMVFRSIAKKDMAGVSSV